MPSPNARILFQIYRLLIPYRSLPCHGNNRYNATYRRALARPLKRWSGNTGRKILDRGPTSSRALTARTTAMASCCAFVSAASRSRNTYRASTPESCRDLKIRVVHEELCHTTHTENRASESRHSSECRLPRSLLHVACIRPVTLTGHRDGGRENTYSQASQR